MCVLYLILCFFFDPFSALHLAHLEAMREYEETADGDELPPLPRFFELADVISMRKGTLPIFSYIVGNFYPLLCGSKEYNTRRACDCTSKIVTTSDEAMILLLLENNFDYWIQVSKAIHDGEALEVGRRKMSDWEIQPQWTYVKEKNNMEWTKDGLLRFVELQKMLAEERKSLAGMALEKELVEEWRNKIANGTIRKKRKRPDEDDDDESVVMPIYGDDDNVVVAV